MTDIKLRTRAAFTAQVSAAITADTLSAGAATAWNAAASGNADGCDHAEGEVDVTTGPSGGSAVCEIWCEPEQHDGSDYQQGYRIATVPIEIGSGATGKFPVNIYNIPQRCNLKLKAITRGFTAALSVKPRYYSDT